MENIIYIMQKERVYLKHLSTGSICSVSKTAFEGTEKPALVEAINNIMPFKSSPTRSNDCLSIYLVCTMQCNLHCPYCFESAVEHRDAQILLPVKDLVAYIDSLILAENYQRLDITFTGGEPLLEFSWITQVVESLEQSFSIPKQYSIITNGTIIDDSIIAFLCKHNVDIQLTFDGARNFHNNTRKGRCFPDGTCDLILKNLHKYGSVVGDYSRITIRANVMSQNYISIEDLLSDLNDLDEKGSINVYFDFLDIEESNPYHIDIETRIAISKYVISQIQKSNMELPSVIASGKFCQYKNNNSISIGPDGILYKCYSLVGGAINVGNIHSSDVSKTLRGVGSLCENNRCPYMEICFGGCPFSKYVQSGTMERNCLYSYLDALNKYLFKTELKDQGLLNIYEDDMHNLLVNL